MLTAVVISFNRLPLLRECLDSLYAQPAHALGEIIVVDQGSTDGSLDLVRADQPVHSNLRLEILPDPSLNAKRNRGIELAKNEIVAFIDDDAVPDAGWAESLVRAFAAPDRWIVTGSVLPLTPGYRRTVRDSPRPRLWKNRFLDKLTIWRCGCGTNMSLHKRCVETIGLFDPAVGTGTALGGCGDEVDYFWRALNAGLNIQYDPAVCVGHHQSADPAVMRRRMWNYYYGIAVLMRKKYAREPAAQSLVVLRLFYAIGCWMLHELEFRNDLAAGDIQAIRGTWLGWFGEQR